MPALLLQWAGDIEINLRPVSTTTPTNCLRLTQWNANGISGKIAELLTFLHSNNVNIAANQETKMTNKAKPLKTPGWAAVRFDRQKNNGGGLLMQFDTCFPGILFMLPFVCPHEQFDSYFPGILFMLPFVCPHEQFDTCFPGILYMLPFVCPHEQFDSYFPGILFMLPFVCPHEQFDTCFPGILFMLPFVCPHEQFDSYFPGILFMLPYVCPHAQFDSCFPGIFFMLPFVCPHEQFDSCFPGIFFMLFFLVSVFGAERLARVKVTLASNMFCCC